MSDNPKPKAQFISVRINEEDLKYLNEAHWEYKESRAGYAARLLHEAIAKARGAK